MKKQKLTYAILTTAVMLLIAVTLTRCTKTNSVSVQQPAVPGGDIAMLSATQPNAAGFIHPGILNTQQSLDIIAGQANSNDAARLAAYQYVLNYCNQHSPSNNYKANVGVAGGVVTADETSFKGDALLAYALALRWAKTGDHTYAVTVKNILDGWANAFRTMYIQSGTEAHQYDLEASWAAPTFAAAAEIIKYYVPANGVVGGWTTAENNQFVIFLNRLKDQYINDVANQHHNNNWDVSAGYAKMAIGVFEDNQTIYQNGLTIIKNMLPLVIQSDGSMPGEICGGNHNDCVHFQYALTGFSYAANIAGIQLDLSVYSASSSRLLAGYKYQYNFYNHNLANPPACVTCSTGSTIWPGIEVANRHYNTTETNFIHSKYNPDSDGMPGGDISFLCWTNYTHNNVSL